MRSSPPSGRQHLPICKETLQNNQVLLVPWGRPRKMKGRRLYKAKVRKENNKIIHFLFENGEHKPNREKLNVYDSRCLSEETCECWWFPTSQEK